MSWRQTTTLRATPFVGGRLAALDESGRFTLELARADLDRIGFWVVRAGVPETECVVLHVFGAPNTATDGVGSHPSPSMPLVLVVAVSGAMAFGVTADA
jgi:hypothetical protein